MTVERTFSDVNSRPPTMADNARAYFVNSLEAITDPDELEAGIVYFGVLYQKLCAESLIKCLRQDEKLRKFGNKALEFLMIETDEPYMYKLALRTSDIQSLHPDLMPINVIALDT